MFLEFMKVEPPKFVVREGKTYMTNEDGGVVEFGDFTLKLLGQLKHRQSTEVNVEGYWVASCGVWVANKIETRYAYG